MTKRDALLDWIDVAHNADIGYDQTNRRGIYDLANHTIKPHSETDCSALTALVIWLAGYGIDLSDPLFTGSLKDKLVAIGWTAKYVRGLPLDQVQALMPEGGEVLLNEKWHVVIQTRRKGVMLSANSDERGGLRGGAAGNQTGSEVSFRPLWMYSHGWDYVLTPPDHVSGASAATPTQKAAALPTQAVDLSEAATRRLQTVLKVAVDGVIGPMTIGAWQARMGTTADRVVNRPSELVRTVQVYVNHVRDSLVRQGRTVSPLWTTLVEDGEWGPKTRAAVEDYLLHWNGAFTR